MIVDIQGFCPMGCGRTLHVHSGAGIVYCVDPTCPDRGAANKLLRQAEETEHIVVINDDGGFAIQHPLRDRVVDELFDCKIHRLVYMLSHGTNIEPGRYRVTVTGEAALRWERLEE